jgi:hypothetical protein
LTIIIGEVLFINKIKVNKVLNKETINSFITKTKLTSYFFSFLIALVSPILLTTTILILLVIILNLPIFLVVMISSLVFFAGVIVGTSLLLKIVVLINKKMFGHLIKKESKEEYEIRQNTYKFRDGTIVKVQPNIVEDMIVDGHRANHRLERQFKASKIYIIDNHNSEGKARIKTFNDEDSASRWECFLEMASLDDILKFKKDKEEYDKKQAIKKQSKLYRFFDWCIDFK